MSPVLLYTVISNLAKGEFTPEDSPHTYLPQDNKLETYLGGILLTKLDNHVAIDQTCLCFRN